MPEKSGRIVNKRELAQIFGVSPQAVDGWLGRGLPFIRKGAALKGYEFDTSTVITWKAQRDIEDAISERVVTGDNDSLKRRNIAEANLAELRFAREAGRLVTIEETEAEWVPRIASLRARLLAIPSQVALTVLAAKSAEEVQSIVQASIYDALNELSDGEELPESPDSDFDSEEFDPEDDSKS